MSGDAERSRPHTAAITEKTVTTVRSLGHARGCASE